ncbi:MAG: hypothetical protein JNK82_16795 [Myxococcaceae bacterium]|nr:hypothetical protein [Myxococcaceae bacterium]
MGSSIGIFSDTAGDLAAFDSALKFLAKKGARRFLFAGGRYEDLDEWVKWKRDEARAQTDYSDMDFLTDLTNFLAEGEQLDRPPAFGTAYELTRHAQELTRMSDKVLRTPEKGSLPYQSPSIPKKAVDMLGDVLCCLVHDKNDLDKEDMLNAVLLVHGKEPEPKVVQIGPRYFLTPGKASGAKPTVALLEMDKQVKFSAFTLDDKTVIDGQVITLGAAKSKISVK